MKFPGLFVALFLFIGCSKTFSPELNEEKELNQVQGNKVSNENAGEKTVEKQNFSSTNLEIFFKSYDTNVLKSFIYVIDEPIQANASGSNVQYMIKKNVELINTLSLIHPSSFTPGEINPDDDLLVYAGLIELYNQLASSSSININRAAFPWDCIWGVVGGILDMGALYSEYKALITQGAKWSTIRPFLWNALKRYGGWIVAGRAVYEIVTECF
jgi:hypothetical protein